VRSFPAFPEELEMTSGEVATGVATTRGFGFATGFATGFGFATSVGLGFAFGFATGVGLGFGLATTAVVVVCRGVVEV